MIIKQVLIIDSHGHVTLRKTRRRLYLYEISINLEISLPGSLFPKPKTFDAPIHVPDDVTADSTIKVTIQ